MENEEPTYSTQKEKPVNFPEKPKTMGTPVHPFPKFLPKKIALIIIILFFVLMLTGLIVTVYNIGKNSADNQKPPVAVSQAPSPTPDPTAEWKTYTGTGFSFKYPEDLILTEENSTENTYIYLKKSGSTYFTLEILNQKSKTLIEAQETEKQIEYNGNNWILHKSSNYCDAGNCGDLAQGYTLRINDIIYTLLIDKGNKEIAEQILSTFKFTDQNSVVDSSVWKITESELNSGWKKYENLKYNYSFSAPRNWIPKFEESTDDRIELFLNQADSKSSPNYGGYPVPVVIVSTHKSEFKDTMESYSENIKELEKFKSEGIDGPGSNDTYTLTKMGGYDAVNVKGCYEGCYDNTIAVSNGLDYSVLIYPYESETNLEIKQNMKNQIVSTFQFTK